jgi:hypothetical protein
MFRHFCVIHRELKKNVPKLYRFLKLRLLKLQSHKIIKLKYIKKLWNFMEP